MNYTVGDKVRFYAEHHPSSVKQLGEIIKVKDCQTVIIKDMYNLADWTIPISNIDKIMEDYPHLLILKQRAKKLTKNVEVNLDEELSDEDN